jgi:hypothetical protein
MPTKFIDTPNPKLAVARAPWAAGIIKVDGGFLAFETVTDYRNWKNQK